MTFFLLVAVFEEVHDPSSFRKFNMLVIFVQQWSPEFGYFISKGFSFKD